MDHWIIDELEQMYIFAEANNLTHLAEELRQLRDRHKYLNTVQKVNVNVEKIEIVH